MLTVGCSLRVLKAYFTRAETDFKKPNQSIINYITSTYFYITGRDMKAFQLLTIASLISGQRRQATTDYFLWTLYTYRKKCQICS